MKRFGGFSIPFLSGLLLLVATGSPHRAIGADPPPAAPRQFKATAEISAAGSGTGTIQVGILVDRVIQRPEAESLIETLDRGGQWALKSAIRDRAAGRLMLGAVHYSLNIITARPSGGGYRYAVVTVRPIKVHERDTGEASLDYPFAVLVFEVDGSGRGEGKLYRKATLRVDPEGQVEVEDFEGEPGRLRNIELQR